MDKEIKYITNLHAHPLTEMLGRSSRKWFCSAVLCGPSGKCLRGHFKNEFQIRPDKGYYCGVDSNKCEFFLCDLCTKEYLIPNEGTITTSLHQHNLNFYVNFPAKWYCDAPNCESKHNKVLQYRNCVAYFCKQCDFLLCDLDAKKYMKAEVKSEITEKRSPIMIKSQNPKETNNICPLSSEKSGEKNKTMLFYIIIF